MDDPLPPEVTRPWGANEREFMRMVEEKFARLIAKRVVDVMSDYLGFYPWRWRS